MTSKISFLKRLLPSVGGSAHNPITCWSSCFRWEGLVKGKEGKEVTFGGFPPLPGLDRANGCLICFMLDKPCAYLCKAARCSPAIFCRGRLEWRSLIRELQGKDVPGYYWRGDRVRNSAALHLLDLVPFSGDASDGRVAAAQAHPAHF